jgi:hypothetical protein
MRKKLLDKIYPKTRHKDVKSECDKLWSKLIKLRAGMKSELSGKTDRLHSHHLIGKSCYALRYSLENGICVTAGEHKFGFHHAGRQFAYNEKVKELRGSDIFEKLSLLKNQKCKDLKLMKLFLENEIKSLT